MEASWADTNEAREAMTRAKHAFTQRTGRAVAAIVNYRRRIYSDAPALEDCSTFPGEIY